MGIAYGHSQIAPTPAQRGRKPKGSLQEAKHKRRIAKRKAERLQLRQTLSQDDDAVLRIKEWCALNGISERHGRRILASGDGPVITWLSGRRYGITRANNRAWLKSRAQNVGR